MLQLFKKKTAPKSNIDQQIHQDVYSAQDLILAEANKILGIAPSFSDEKTKRLEKLSRLGFSAADEVRTMDIERHLKSDAKHIQDRINYFSQNYPLNKFIDEKSVEKICKKYGLILAPSDRYVAEIPEKNQIEIINFRVKASDIYLPIGEFRWGHERAYAQEHLGSNKDKMIEGFRMKIVAPKAKINTQNMRLDDYKLVQNIKDPIVLQPVKGGYLIVTSWGLEASDPLVVNPTKN